MAFAQGQKNAMFGNAASYDRFMGRWSRMLATHFIRFVDLPQNANVLDVGCGTGALSFALLEDARQRHVTGIDLSATYVAAAQQQNRFGDRATFATGDAQHLQFPDATFGASVALLVLNFVPDPPAAIREMVRVTAKGGTVAAAVWDFQKGMEMIRLFWVAATAALPGVKIPKETPTPLSHAGELKTAWTQAGLGNVEERALSFQMKFASFDDYWEPLLSGEGPSGNFLRKLSEEQKGAVREELKKHLPLQSADQPFTLPASAWAVRGTVV